MLLLLPNVQAILLFFVQLAVNTRCCSAHGHQDDAELQFLNLCCVKA